MTSAFHALGVLDVERGMQSEVAAGVAAYAQALEPRVDLLRPPGRRQLDDPEGADGVEGIAAVDREADEEIAQGERLRNDLLCGLRGGSTDAELLGEPRQHRTVHRRSG